MCNQNTISNKFDLILTTTLSSYKTPQKVCHMPVGQKLREEIDFLETGCFRPVATTFGPADQILRPKNYLRGVGLVLKISSKSFHSIKSYSTF
jgi:hypothetical protein